MEVYWVAALRQIQWSQRFAREVTKDHGKGKIWVEEEKEQCTFRERKGKRIRKRGENKMSGLYREESLGEEQCSPLGWKGQGWRQGTPGRDWGILEEPSSQICSGM